MPAELLDKELRDRILALARRLYLAGGQPEALAIAREIFALLRNERALRSLLPAWLATLAASPRRQIAPPSAAASASMQSIASVLGAITGAPDAVRALTTLCGIAPAAGAGIAGHALRFPQERRIRPADLRRTLAEPELVIAGPAVLSRFSREPRGRSFLEQARQAVENMPERSPHALSDRDAHLLLRTGLNLRAAGDPEGGLRLAYAGMSAMEPKRSVRRILQTAREPASPFMDEAAENLLSKGYPGEATTLLLDTAAHDPMLIDRLWRPLEPKVQAPGVDLPQAIARSGRTAALPGAAVTRGDVAKPRAPAGRKTAAKRRPATRGLAPNGGRTLSPPAPPPRRPEGESPPDPEMFFEFDERASGNRVRLDSEVDLCFRYDIPGKAPLGKVTGKRAGQVKDEIKSGSDVDVGVYVAPVGLEFRDDDDPYKVARFRGRKMSAPVVFRLRAPDKPVDKSGIGAVLTYRGAEFYRAFFPVELVTDVAAQPAAPQVIGVSPASVAAADQLPRDVTAYIQRRKAGAEYLLSVTRKGSKKKGKPDYFDVGRFEAVSGQVKELMHQAANSRKFTSVRPEDWEADPRNRDTFHDALELVLSAGHLVYKYLNETAAGRQLRDAIESAPEGARISIYTPDVFIPWEIVYPLDYWYSHPEEYKQPNFDPKQLWGYRWQFENMLNPEFLNCETAGSLLPATRTQPRPLEIRVGIGGTVEEDSPTGASGGFPAAKWHEDYCDRNKGCMLYLGDDTHKIKEALQKEGYPGSLLYFMCHGAQNGPVQSLEFSPCFTATPEDLTASPYAAWPVVFLNSCSSGDIQPHNFSSFLERFRCKNSYGLVASSFTMPIVFGAVFAGEFMDAYRNKQRIGEILLNLRKKFLDQDNPLACFYTLQCPLDVRAPE